MTGDGGSLAINVQRESLTHLGLYCISPYKADIVLNKRIEGRSEPVLKAESHPAAGSIQPKLQKHYIALELKSIQDTHTSRQQKHDTIRQKQYRLLASIADAHHRQQRTAHALAAAAFCHDSNLGGGFLAGGAAGCGDLDSSFFGFFLAGFSSAFGGG